MEVKIKKEDSKIRLDIFLVNLLNENRSFINKHIKLNNILVNKKSVKSGFILKENDVIEIGDLKEEIKIEGENIPLDIYYEDEYLLVVNKPSGMVVHPAAGNYSHTLVNALIYHTKNDLSSVNDEFRPGIVHRIDKDTSGLLVISKNNKVHNILANNFKNKTIKRKYIALVKGVITENKGKIEAPIGRSIYDRKKMDIVENGKKAITNFTVLERYKNATLLELELETGRTHQIRVHLAYINHPIINDIVYNKDKPINDYGQMLHAAYLGFNHPIANKYLEFNAPLEKEFLNILNKIKN